jgi:hypothetical protein
MFAPDLATQASNGLAVLEARVQFLAGVAPNQQGDKGTDLGVGERGCHGDQAFVYRMRVDRSSNS